MNTYIENIDKKFKEHKNKNISTIPKQTQYDGEYIFNNKIVKRPSYIDKHKYQKLLEEQKKIKNKLHNYEYNKARDYFVDEINIKEIKQKLEHYDMLITKYIKNKENINKASCELKTKYNKQIEKNRTTYIDKLTNRDEIREYLTEKKEIENINKKILDNKEHIDDTLILSETDLIIIYLNKTTDISSKDLINLKTIALDINTTNDTKNKKNKKNKNDKHDKTGGAEHKHKKHKKTLKNLNTNNDNKAHTQNPRSILRKKSIKNINNISWKNYCANGTPIIDNSGEHMSIFEDLTPIDMDTIQVGGYDIDNISDNSSIDLNNISDDSNVIDITDTMDSEQVQQMSGGNTEDIANNNLDVDSSIIQPQIKNDFSKIPSDDNIAFDNKKSNYDFRTMYEYDDANSVNDIISSDSNGLLSTDFLTKKLNEGHSDNLTLDVLGDNNKNYSTAPYAHLQGNNDNEKLLQLKQLQGGGNNNSKISVQRPQKQKNIAHKVVIPEIISPTATIADTHQAVAQQPSQKKTNNNFNEITINTSNIPTNNFNTNVVPHTTSHIARRTEQQPMFKKTSNNDIPMFDTTNVKVISIK
jgi:hypothetical protein